MASQIKLQLETEEFFWRSQSLVLDSLGRSSENCSTITSCHCLILRPFMCWPTAHISKHTWQTWSGLVDALTQEEPALLFNNSLQIPSSFALIIFAAGTHPLLPCLMHNTRTRREYRSSVVVGWAMFTVISVVLGGGFFYMFGALEKIRLLEVRRLYHLDHIHIGSKRIKMNGGLKMSEEVGRCMPIVCIWCSFFCDLLMIDMIVYQFW